LVGPASAEVEGKMEKTIKTQLEKNPTFTTNKGANATGYTIRLKVSEFKVDGGKTKVRITGEILYYPTKKTATRGEGTEMLSTGMSGGATADGADKQAIFDAVEAITEDLIKKAIPIMSKDAANRS
jgi:hypothetical protein